MADFLSYFKESYEESRRSFQELAKSFNGELRSHRIPSQKESDLTFESLYLAPAAGQKEQLLILTSGIHGIEGFTGSALQRYFMANNYFDLKDDKTGILIIHGINPYGFKHKRRVTENNVDLNRNFDTSEDLFLTKNPGYEQVYDFLNPRERISKFSFFASAASFILRYGVRSLRSAILSGQYYFPEGLFFGGTKFEPQVALLKHEIMSVGEGFQKVLLVDLHTGYGESGKLHLFGNKSSFIDQEYMDTVFKGLPVDYGDAKDFYAINGGFTVFLAKLFHHKAKYAGVCFEMGTIDSQNLGGSLDSLYRMINENQINQTSQDRAAFTEMFYPSSQKWRKNTVEQFQNKLKLVCHNLKKS
jgi:hypothetical protein